MKITKPKRWRDRSWIDVHSGWQFRTFKSNRNFNLMLSIDDMQGDGIFLIGGHLFKNALVFEFPFNGNKPYPKCNWRLFK